MANDNDFTVNNSYTVHEALMWAFEYFEFRDQSNAKIHCAPVRYSPITFRLCDALMLLQPTDSDITSEMARVIHHKGKHEEEKE